MACAELGLLALFGEGRLGFGLDPFRASVAQAYLAQRQGRPGHPAAAASPGFRKEAFAPRIGTEGEALTPRVWQQVSGRFASQRKLSGFGLPTVLCPPPASVRRWREARALAMRVEGCPLGAALGHPLTRHEVEAGALASRAWYEDLASARKAWRAQQWWQFAKLNVDPGGAPRSGG